MAVLQALYRLIRVVYDVPCRPALVRPTPVPQCVIRLLPPPSAQAPPVNLSHPVKALKELRSLLSDRGTLIVREVDDGLNMASPDPGDRFKKFFEITSGDSRMGDRHCGRKVYTYLRNAGFQIVRLEKEGLSNISMPDRELLYDMSIPFFLDYMKKRSENAPDNNQYREAYEWFVDNIDEMRDCFIKKDFFITYGFMSFTAM